MQKLKYFFTTKARLRSASSSRLKAIHSGKLHICLQLVYSEIVLKGLHVTSKLYSLALKNIP